MAGWKTGGWCLIEASHREKGRERDRGQGGGGKNRTRTAWRAEHRERGVGYVEGGLQERQEALTEPTGGRATREATELREAT